MGVVNAAYGRSMKMEEEAAAPLAGGLMNQGFQCGLLWGASLAAGIEAHRRFGAGPAAQCEAIKATEKVVEVFKTRTKEEINCSEITEMNLQDLQFKPFLKLLVKGGKVGAGACFRLAAGYAQDVYQTIDAELPEEASQAMAEPASCAAELAAKMGASAEHQTMAAGFAGGIGLSGGGCGALGTAIWLTALNSRAEGEKKVAYADNARYQEIIDTFVESADYQFECREITGRQFQSVEDHADYLRQGGCQHIIDALVGKGLKDAAAY